MEHSKIKNIIIGILAVLLLAAVGFIAWYSTRPAAPELERFPWRPRPQASRRRTESRFPAIHSSLPTVPQAL